MSFFITSIFPWDMDSLWTKSLLLFSWAGWPSITLLILLFEKAKYCVDRHLWPYLILIKNRNLYQFLPIEPFTQYQKKKKGRQVDLGERGVQWELGWVERREIVVRMYCIRIFYFQFKKYTIYWVNFLLRNHIELNMSSQCPHKSQKLQLAVKVVWKTATSFF